MSIVLLLLGELATTCNGEEIYTWTTPPEAASSMMMRFESRCGAASATAFLGSIGRNSKGCVMSTLLDKWWNHHVQAHDPGQAG
jgi:hypothetical protein